MRALNRSKAAAVAAALIIVMSSCIVFVSADDPSYATDPNPQKVTYHPYYGSAPITSSNSYNYATASEVTVTTYGDVVSTEYNPQVWEVASKWYEIREYSKGETLVFTGWAYAVYSNGALSGVTTETYLPGDVLTDEQVAMAKDPNGVVHIYATWGYIDNISTSFSSANFSGGSVYTNFVLVYSTYLTPNMSKLGANHGSFTLRSTEREWDWGYVYKPTSNKTTVNCNDVSLQADVIVDGVTLNMSRSGTSNHGEEECGIFANGHRLVIGTGVSTDGSANSNDQAFPQITGGSKGTDGSISSSGFATTVIIHSGTYSSLVAGSNQGTITGDTKLVMRGGTVLDTIVGGSSSYYSTINGDTYVYILGKAFLPGDTYEEDRIGSDRWKLNDPGFTLYESTIITGGSNGLYDGKSSTAFIHGSTNVYISGEAEVWDVQAPGRRASSTVEETSSVFVSGKAWVKHMVSGSITDGNGTGVDMSCVKHTNIVVKDDALVGSVFGAGYDTWTTPTNVSMMGSDSTISVSIEGGTVGYVYGGGYRGTVGTPSEPIGSISISISGGNVIGDVFGGGRGGVDKILHNEDGSQSNSGSGFSDSTGYSKVYAQSISVSITGGIVRGSVYGGGESVPQMGDSFGAQMGVASVGADSISVSVSDGVTIGGSVYGGGKGVQPGGIGADPACVITAKWNGGEAEIVKIPWRKNVPGYVSTGNYTGYAAVTGNISVTIDGATVNVNVYGGGSMGKVGYSLDEEKVNLYDITVNIIGSTIRGCVYGTGEGLSSDSAYGRVDAVDVNLIISGSTVGAGENSVYGAGMYAPTTVDGTLTIQLGDGDSVTTLNGNVYAGGLGVSGRSSLAGDRSLILNNVMVSGSIFGGSAYGDDGPVTEQSRSAGVRDTARLYLIAGVISQNVYGGGFLGSSNMDAEIYFGTPAVDAIRPATLPSDMNLRVLSIYGGGYYDPSSGTPYTSTLLQGDVLISMGSGPLTGGYQFNGYSNTGSVSSDSGKISVYGDVYGEGGFSLIGGESRVELVNYTQTADSMSLMMCSFQRIDVLSIENSSIDLRGSSDGGSSELSELLSFSRIGTLELRGSSLLDLHAGTNAIDALFSFNTSGQTSTSGDFPSACGNTVRLHEGMVFMVLGPENNGLDGSGAASGMIHGFVHITLDDSEGYYGGFASGTSQTDENYGGFVVTVDGVYEPAQFVSEGDITYWFISGTTAIERVMTFTHNGAQYQASSVSMDVPLISSSSTLSYSGAYVDYAIQNSVYFVASDRYEGYSGGSALVGMSLSSGGKTASVETHAYVEGGWHSIADDPVELTSNRLTLTPTVYTYSDLDAGLLGYLVIHLVESAVYSDVSVPIHTVNLVIGIYFDPYVSDGGHITVDMTVNSSATGYYGTGYLTLPQEGSLYSYTLGGFSISGGAELSHMSMVADSSYFGRNGWSSSPYTNVGYVPSSSADVAFGVGGAISPVIRIDYSGNTQLDDVAAIEFTVTLTSISGSAEITYSITVSMEKATDVNLSMQYTSIEGTTYVLQVQQAVAGESQVITYDYVLSWVVKGQEPEGSVSGIQLPFGTIVNIHPYSCLVVSDKKEMECRTLLEALNALVEIIPDEEVSGEQFTYSQHFEGWFTDQKMLNKFSTGAPGVSQDVMLYGCFGVTVTFDFGVNVMDQKVVISPGTSLQDINIYNYNESWTDRSQVVGYEYFAGSKGYTGHTIKSGGWVLNPYIPEQTYNFGQDLISDIILYMVWDVETYTVQMTVANESSTDFTVGDVSITNGTGLTSSEDVYSFSVSYGSAVSVGFLNGFHVTSDNATGSYGDGLRLVFTGPTASTTTLSFRVPDAGNEGAVIAIKLSVSKNMDVVVDLVHSGGYTSMLYGGAAISAVAGDESGSLDGTVSGLATGTITLRAEPGETVKVSVTQGYIMTVWVDGTLQAGGSNRVDSYEYTVSEASINPVISVAVHRAVSLTAESGVAGIDHVTVYHVNAPSNPDGGWGHAQTGNVVSMVQVVAGSYHVTECDLLVVTPGEGYYMPNDYRPENSIRASTSLGGAVTVCFAVTGSGDVVFGSLSPSEVTVKFTVHVLNVSEAVASATEVASLPYGTIVLSFGGTAYQLAASASGASVTITYDSETTDLWYSAGLTGFQTKSGTYSGSGDVEISLAPATYTVHYAPAPDAESQDVDSVAWTVYSGSGISTKVTTCNGIWLKTLGGEAQGFIEEISVDEFDYSRNLYVSAVSAPVGSATPPSSAEDAEVVTIILTLREVEAGAAVLGSMFNGQAVSFTDSGVTWFSYDPRTGIATLDMPNATGFRQDIENGWCLRVYVVAGAEGVA